jgi:macrolide-specific efflux system membrane fusion protein
MKKWLWGFAALILISSLGGYLYLKSSQHEGPTYRTVQVKKGEIAISVLSTGTVAPANKLNIQSPIAGRAERVLVDQGQMVKKDQILLWVSSSERAALLDGARGVSEEEVKKWEDLYKPTPVLAPVSGMIIQRNIQPGQTFTTSDPIMVMSDHLIVQVQVDETDLAQIHQNQEAQIVLDAYPDDMIEGRVKKIAFDAKTVNNVTTYEVDVLPNEVPKVMRSGMTANVTFPAGSKGDALTIPSDAVKTRNGSPYVLVPVQGKSDPEKRNVSLGVTDGHRVEITSGLVEGESVLEPEFRLRGAKNIGSSPFGANRGPGGGPGGGRGGRGGR